MTDRTLVEVLDIAIATLEKREWIQRSLFLYDHDARIVGCCMVGAFAVGISSTADDASVSWLENHDPAWEELKALHTQVAGVDCGRAYELGRPMSEWNDLPGMTKERVLHAMRQMRDLAREKASGTQPNA